MAKLGKRQLRFIEEYLVDLNGTQAAIRAGYSKRTANEQASRLLANVNIRQKVDAAIKERSERTKIDQDYVLNTIVDTIERCKQARPVLDKSGNPVMVETPDGNLAPAYVFEPNAIFRGTDQLAKHVGFYLEDNKQKTDALSKILDRVSGNGLQPVEE